MIKRWILNFKFALVFLRVVRDPTRTLEIFKGITHPYIMKPEGFVIVMDKLNDNPQSAEMLRTRYEGTWSLDELLKLPEDTFGYIYAKHMRDNGLAIDFYPPVPGEYPLAYVQRRMRQTHDIWHILTGFDTSVPGEMGLQAFTQAQIRARSPSLIMAMFMLHCVLYDPSKIFEATAAVSRGWAMGLTAKPLFAQKFEERWTMNLEEFRRELNLPAAAPAYSREAEFSA